MTYIVGFKQQKTNSIIADRRITFQTPYGDIIQRFEDQNCIDKIGEFFPGCIYGYCGDALLATKFISSFYDQYVGTTAISIEFWNRLRDHIVLFDFLPCVDHPFQLLLSSDHSGTPTFFVLETSSGRGELREQQVDKFSCVTLGSGKPLLDEYLNNHLLSIMRDMIPEYVRRFDDPKYGFV
jgi:hypothetical protein